MAVDIEPMFQLLITISITTGAIGMGFTTFILTEKAKKRLSPLIFIVGSISSLAFFLTTFISLFSPFINWPYLFHINYFLVSVGTLLLIYYLIYIISKLIKIKMDLII